MTRTHFHGPGDADALDGLCLVCLMVARGAELDETEDEWKRLEADGHDELQKWYAWDGTRTLIRPAVTDGISDILGAQVGPVPLCWDHLGGLTLPKRGSRLANGGRLPPGLHRGRG
ncbi:MAG TPA: hypothetical protein VGR98_21095 [Streptosporangiaceae bacterium]|nr:hypothetical protein [Streptosporangiaceae bacterium]